MVNDHDDDGAAADGDFANNTDSLKEMIIPLVRYTALNATRMVIRVEEVKTTTTAQERRYYPPRRRHFHIPYIIYYSNIIIIYSNIIIIVTQS